MSSNVYLIHAAEDSSPANELRARLRAEGIDCSPSQQGGGEWNTEAEQRAIEESQVVVFVFSAQANNSPFIERLLRHAFAVKKSVIHVYVEKVEPSAALKQLLKDSRYVLESWLTPETRQDLIVQRVRKWEGDSLATGPRDAASKRGAASARILAEDPVAEIFRGSSSRRASSDDVYEREPPTDRVPPTSSAGRNSSPRRGVGGSESLPGSDRPAQRTRPASRVGSAAPPRAAPAAPPPPAQLEQRTNKAASKEAEIAKGRTPVKGPELKRPGFFSRLFNREARLPIDKVDCSVFAPPRVAPAESFLVQVFAHCPDQAEAARELAKEFDRDAERHGKKTLEAQVQQGSRLTFHLVMPGLTVAEPLQSLTWWGNTESVQFEVKAPKAFKGTSSIGTVTVCLENVPIGNIKFKLPVTGSKQKKEAPLKLAGDAARAYQKAFISYASADRTEVLKRVQMLARLNIEYFQDVLTLEPGARWEKELYRHIDESDLFLLFWSSEAKRSKWVLEEVRYALKRKGADELSPPEIVPVIIEGPPPVAPPAELAHLHFNDYIVYFLNE